MRLILPSPVTAFPTLPEGGWICSQSPTKFREEPLARGSEAYRPGRLQAEHINPHLLFSTFPILGGWHFVLLNRTITHVGWLPKLAIGNISHQKSKTLAYLFRSLLGIWSNSKKNVDSLILLQVFFVPITLISSQSWWQLDFENRRGLIGAAIQV